MDLVPPRVRAVMRLEARDAEGRAGGTELTGLVVPIGRGELVAVKGLSFSPG